ncbi:MAG: class I SAM-dependent methyltransferase [Thermodesulfobacteriota bacterium]
MRQDQFPLHADIEETHWWFVGRTELVKTVVSSVLCPSADSLVVDVGCGTGGIVGALAKDYSCVGMDAASDGIALAGARFPDIPFLLGSTPHDLGERASRLDLMLMLDVLEHVEQDREFLAGFIEPLKPGAHVLLTVPAGTALWSPHDENYGHYRRYEPATFRALWSGLNVREVFVTYFNVFLYPAVRLVRLLNRLTGRSWGAAGTDLSVPISPLNWLLRRIFTGEARVLANLAKGKRTRGFTFGVSLMALLTKPQEGSHESLPEETLLKKGCPPGPFPKTFETSGGSDRRGSS